MAVRFDLALTGLPITTIALRLASRFEKTKDETNEVNTPLLGLAIVQDIGKAGQTMETQPDRLGQNDYGQTWPQGSHAFRDQLNLWKEVLQLAGSVETAFQTAVTALCEARPELIDLVKAEEVEIDRCEVRIEQQCLKVLALYGLVASDLRRVVSAIRVNKELEGLGDLAENIAKRAKKLSKDPIAAPYLAKLSRLADGVIALIAESLGSLRLTDAERARKVISLDNAVDDQRGIVVRELKEAMRERPDRVNTWLRLINSARNLERAADHATNIAEAVIYMKEGVIVRRDGDGARVVDE